MSEVRQRLRDVAWREAMDSWKEEARSHSKWAGVQKLIEKGYEARCVEVKCKRRRGILVQLRGGTAALEVETADGEVLAEKEGCVGIVEVRRWRMWNTGC